MRQFFTRLRDRIAPKLLAFLASGLTTSGLIAGAQLLGLPVDPFVAVVLVGGVSTVASWIKRDELLLLGPGQFSLKVIAFIISSATVTGVVAFIGAFGVDLSPYSALIGFALTTVGGLVGAAKSDQTTDEPAKHRAPDGV